HSGSDFHAEQRRHRRAARDESVLWSCCGRSASITVEIWREVQLLAKPRFSDAFWGERESRSPRFFWSRIKVGMSSMLFVVLMGLSSVAPSWQGNGGNRPSA